MSDVHAAPEAEVVTIPAIAPAEQSNTPIDVSQAARALSEWRKTRDKPAEPPAPEKEAPAEPPQELAETPNSEPDEGAETTEAQEPAELPPIEPPRSWSKEWKEEFATYPREAQEKILQREQERDSAIRRGQNEVADARKQIEAERQAAEQARKQYETALPQLLQALQDQQAGEFADVKTPADIEKLCDDDPLRFIKWTAHQQKVAAVHREFQQVQERQAIEYKKQWSDYASKQDAELAERAPELKDPERARKVADGARGVLKDLGFNDQELGQLWNGEASLSLRDHRLQLLLLDGVKYREAKASVSKPTPKPVPPVQRPGAAPNKGAQLVARVEEASQKLSNARGNAAVQAGLELLRAQRAASRR